MDAAEVGSVEAATDLAEAAIETAGAAAIEDDRQSVDGPSLRPLRRKTWKATMYPRPDSGRVAEFLARNMPMGVLARTDRHPN